MNPQLSTFRAPSLFPEPAGVDPSPPRQVLVVPAGGLCEKFLREALGAAASELNPLFGAEIGCPRDYTWPRGGCSHVFTLTGVKRVMELLGLPIVVIAEGQPVPVDASNSTGPLFSPYRRPRGPWWLQDLSEGDK